jgi:Major tropism determinant N-terminal domain
MAAFTYQGTIQFRRQTAAQWTAANPILAQGELGLELDTKYFKMGDGTTAWTALAYGGMSSPNGTTATPGDNSTLFATTAFVNNATNGVTNVTLGGSNITLTTAQAGSSTIVLNGTLTANVTITFPASGRWTVVNNTTGAFTVTLVSTTGGSIVLPTSSAVIAMSLSTGLTFANSLVPATTLSSPSQAPVSMGWLGQVLTGVNTVNITGNMTLTPDQCAYSILLFVGSLGSSATVTLPTVPVGVGQAATAIVWNQSGQSITFTTTVAGGGTLTLANGESASATLSNLYGIYLVDQVAPTPPAGDNSHKIATTTFVQNLSNGTNVISISGNTTLNASQYSFSCLTINGTTSADATITLPSQGWWTIVNNTTGGYSLVLTNGGAGTFTITNGDSAEVIVNSSGVFVTSTITALVPPGKNDNSIASTAFVQSVPYRRNRILNGQFDVWQRGVSWTTPASGTYTADKWRVDYTGTSAGAFTIGQALAGTQPAGLTASLGPYGAYSWNQTSAPNLTSMMLSHRCEGIYVLNGQTCTVSFSIALGAGSQTAFNIGVNIAQCFGTGGSPSATVTQTTQYFTVNSTSFQRFSATFTLPTTTGTLGTSANDYVAVQFVLPTSSTFSFYMTQVQLEGGPVATPYMVQTTQQEILQCLRFYRKTFPTTTVPTYNTGNYTSPLTISQGGSSVSQWTNWNFDVPMRGIPVITYYSVGNNATAYWTPITSGTPTAIALIGAKISAAGVTVGTPPTIGVNTTYVLHAAADADL